MNSFASKLRLKGMAEEDIYFAKLDQELIEALRQKKKKRKIGSGPAVSPVNQNIEARDKT